MNSILNFVLFCLKLGIFQEVFKSKARFSKFLIEGFKNRLECFRPLLLVQNQQKRFFFFPICAQERALIPLVVYLTLVLEKFHKM